MELKEYVYLDFFIYLNVKSLSKGERVLKLIQEQLGMDLFVEELYESGSNEFTANCFVKLNNSNPKILITDSLILLNRIGVNWVVECPNLEHDDYWKFKGERGATPRAFKINGIDYIGFELSDYKRDRDIEFMLKNAT